MGSLINILLIPLSLQVKTKGYKSQWFQHMTWPITAAGGPGCSGRSVLWNGESKQVGVAADSKHVTHNRKNRLCLGCLFYANGRANYSKDKIGYRVMVENGWLEWSRQHHLKLKISHERPPLWLICNVHPPAACTVQAAEAWGTIRTKYRSVWSQRTGILQEKHANDFLYLKRNVDAPNSVLLCAVQTSRSRTIYQTFSYRAPGL